MVTCMPIVSVASPKPKPKAKEPSRLRSSEAPASLSRFVTPDSEVNTVPCGATTPEPIPSSTGLFGGSRSFVRDCSDSTNSSALTDGSRGAASISRTGSAPRTCRSVVISAAPSDGLFWAIAAPPTRPAHRPITLAEIRNSTSKSLFGSA